MCFLPLVDVVQIRSDTIPRTGEPVPSFATVLTQRLYTRTPGDEFQIGGHLSFPMKGGPVPAPPLQLARHQPIRLAARLN
jgi:hypothetical protein